MKGSLDRTPSPGQMATEHEAWKHNLPVLAAVDVAWSEFVSVAASCSTSFAVQ